MHEQNQKPLRKFFNPQFKKLCAAFYDLRSGSAIMPDGASVENISSIFEILNNENIDAIFCLHSDDADLLTEIKNNSDAGWIINWTTTDDANGGCVSRSGRLVYISSLIKSYFENCDDLITAFNSFRALENIFLSHQKGARLNLLSSPTMTGLVYLACCLPTGKTYEPQSDDLLNTLAQFTTQSRHELLTLPELQQIKSFYYFDARFMYAACAYYELPCGEPTRDNKNVFELYSVGWYRINAEIPRGWSHVGILPLRNNSETKSEKKWLWPSEAGFCFSGIWVTEPELRLAVNHGWHVEILERVLWSKNKMPLRSWQQSIVAMRDEAARLDEPLRSNVRDALRSILINAIGAMAARDERQSYDLSAQEFLAERRSFTPEIRATLRPLDDGSLRVVKPKAKSEFRAQFSRYEWTAYIWGRARAMLTERMLSVPRETILGCRVDAIYLTQKPNWTDSGISGQFRCKGLIEGQSIQAPHTLKELAELRQQAEAGV